MIKMKGLTSMQWLVKSIVSCESLGLEESF
jgi:hypothetical protein